MSMRRISISIAEKKLLHAAILFALINLLVVFLSLCLLRGTQQINLSDTKQIEIIVDDMYVIRVPREYWLIVVADSTEYLFMSRSTIKEYSVGELEQSISIGDKLLLTYFESDSGLLKKSKVVVGARTEIELFRSLEEYNQGRQGAPMVVVIITSIVMIVIWGVGFILLWLNNNTIKYLYRKIKKKKGTV